jgi:hypothetical protein
VAPLAQINHPSWRWQFTSKDIAGVKGADLIEIANEHPGSNNIGAGPEAPGTEQIWDELLSQGTPIWGVASDDSHEFKPGSLAGTAGSGAAPGKGWIVVRAAHLSVDDIVRAINVGDFYASTGVTLRDYQANQKQIAITIRSDGDHKYRVQFIGKNGRVLQDTYSNSAIYSIKGDEGYVRAKITDSDGRMAWTQPTFVNK